MGFAAGYSTAKRRRYPDSAPSPQVSFRYADGVSTAGAVGAADNTGAAGTVSSAGTAGDAGAVSSVGAARTPGSPIRTSDVRLHAPRASAARTAPKQRTTRYTHGRIGGLDGLRAIACIAVLLYHTWPAVMPGGFLGVDVFFVLSGFLITALLIREISSPTGAHRINIVNFWIRRWRRLFPAVFTVCVITIPLAWAADPNLLARIKSQLLGTLTFSYNWVALGTSSSYFDHGNPRLLTNMWTLSVEQQFYLIWPLILTLIFLLPRRWRPSIPVALAGISVALMAWFASGSADVSRAYMGTDSHSFGLMLGAALAFLSPRPFSTRMHRADRRFSRAWGMAGFLGLAGIIAAFTLLSDSAPGVYPWWTLLTVCASAYVIHALTARAQAGGSAAAMLRSLLDVKPLQWLGVRSYGIYLWHWPLLLIWRRLMPSSPPWLTSILVAVLATVCAAVSLSLVENPMRSAGIVPTVCIWFTAVRRLSHTYLRVGICAFVAIWFGLFTFAVIQAPAQTDVEQMLTGSSSPADPGRRSADSTPRHTGAAAPNARTTPDSGTPTSSTAQQKQQQKKPAVPPTPPSNTGSDATPHAGATSADAGKAAAPQASPAPSPIAGKDITIIGDSVVEAAKYSLAERWPGITIDAGVSRQGYEIADLIQAHLRGGTLQRYVVINNATNGKLPDSMLRDWLNIIGKSRVLILVTGHGPANDTWIAESNAAIHRVARQYPGRIVIADWDRAASAHPELLYSDGVHPIRPSGADYYCTMMAQALSSAQKLRG